MMNYIKARLTAREIATLFVCSSLLIGLMTISLSLPQTALATSRGNPPEMPQCPPGTTSFERGICESEPTLKCNTAAGFQLLGNQCVKVTQQQPTLNCLTAAGFQLQGNVCVKETRQAPNCGSGIYDASDNRCESGGPFSLPTGQNPCNTAAGFNLENDQCVKRESQTPTKQCNTAAGFNLEGNVCVKRESQTPTKQCSVGELNGEVCQVRPGRGSGNV